MLDQCLHGGRLVGASCVRADSAPSNADSAPSKLVPGTWCQLTGGEPSSWPPVSSFTFSNFYFYLLGGQGQDGQRPFCSPLDKLWGLPMLKVCYVGQEYFQSIEKFTVPPFSFTLNKLNSLSYYLLLSRS